MKRTGFSPKKKFLSGTIGIGVMLLMACSGQKNVEEAADSKSPYLISDAACESTAEPICEPTTEPTCEPTAEPTCEPTAEPTCTPPPNPYDFTLCFAGDINLDEAWCTTQYLNQQENGIRDCISEELITYMNQADIMCLNNEFTYSTGGTPLEGKMYTFRANPERVSILQEMGVDLVKLANNHVYDYGREALLDTFDTLDGAGIAYMGAGRNLEEAMEPVYRELDGKRIAFVAASRAEKYKMTPQATEDSPGILRCYDTTLFFGNHCQGQGECRFCNCLCALGNRIQL
jgi:poly-gamma-glutamate synthesis protein (capsule biosynthesis protein)